MQHQQELIDTLQRAFPRAGADALQSLVDCGTVQHYAPGSVLCHQGEHEPVYGVLIAGQADVYMSQPSGRSFVAYLRGGSTLGGMEYITGTPRIADVVASEPVTLLEMSFDALDAVVERHPAILKALARELVTEILRSQDRFMQLSTAATAGTSGFEVFVSYARADVEFAKRLTNGLRRHDIAVWLDLFSITAGKSWNRQIGEALDRTRLMVLVVSPRSMASENSDDEWNYFLDKHKPVIPVLQEATDIPYRLNKLQFIDFAQQPFDSALTQLVLTIQRAAAEPTDGAGQRDV